MLINTRCFGEIDLSDDKIITFEQGLMGFEDYKNYTILYDIEEGEKGTISWLQSTEEKDLAFPVIDPIYVKEDYNPTVEDELIKPLGEITEDNLILLLLLTVPADVKKMTANLKAPLIINSDTRKGSQIIVENADYEIKYNVYDALQLAKAEKGED